MPKAPQFTINAFRLLLLRSASRCLLGLRHEEQGDGDDNCERECEAECTIAFHFPRSHLLRYYNTTYNWVRWYEKCLNGLCFDIVSLAHNPHISVCWLVPSCSPLRDRPQHQFHSSAQCNARQSHYKASHYCVSVSLETFRLCHVLMISRLMSLYIMAMV